ncbi:MAG TPA: hypothetical protein VF469_17145 [Kofleriaceae bacterium]
MLRWVMSGMPFLGGRGQVTRAFVPAALMCAALWASSAAAGPARITAPGVDAFDAPSKASVVVSKLEGGAQVCVLDASNYAGILHRRQGWIAIRVPGGVGYVPIEAVDSSVPAAAAAPGASASAPPAPALDCAPSRAQDVQRQTLAPVEVETEPASEARPTPVSDRPALIAGGFLPLRPARVMFGLGGGVASLDKAAAASQQFADSGPTLNGALGVTVWDIFMVSGSFSVAHPSDNNSFSQPVMPVDGGATSTADSSLSVVSYSIAIGLRTPFKALAPTQRSWVAGSLFAEYGAAGVTGSRSIIDCQDCRSDDLAVSGGAFWQAGADLLIPTRSPKTFWGLEVSYLSYAAGTTFSNELRVNVTCWL